MGTALITAEVKGLVHLGTRSAIADIAGRLGGPVGQLEIVEAQEVKWRDAGVGCPEPGNSYAQVLTSRLRLVLAVGDTGERQNYDYRITYFHGTLCENRVTEAPLESRPIAGVWSQLADMPTARSEVAADQVDEKIYVMGGFGSEAATNEAYDIKTNTLSVVAPFPEGVDHAAAVAVDGQVYLIDGLNERRAPESKVWSYDQVSDRRQRRAELPTARGGMGAARNVGTLEVYDPTQDT